MHHRRCPVIEVVASMAARIEKMGAGRVGAVLVVALADPPDTEDPAVMAAAEVLVAARIWPL